MLCEEFDNTAAADGVRPGVPVKLFVLHNGQAAHFGTATVSNLCTTSDTEGVRSMPNQHLSYKQGADLLVIRTVDIVDSIKDLANTYTLHTEDEVPSTFA